MKTAKNFLSFLAAFGAVFAPNAVFGQNSATGDTFLNFFSDVVQTIVYVLISVAILSFIYGVIKYVIAGEDENRKRQGRMVMIYGVVGIFAIVSIWGLVALLANMFGVMLGGTGPAPVAPGGGNDNISKLLGIINSWVTVIIGILIGLGVAAFFWGVIKYVIAGVDEEKKREGRAMMLYGVFGVFVMVALWGLVALLALFFGINLGGDTGELAGYIPGGTSTADNKLVDLFLQFGGWFRDIVIILIGVGIAFLFWGIVKYVIAGANQESRTKGMKLILYGLIGVLVMTGIWGLVSLIATTLGVTFEGGGTAPQIVISDQGTAESQKFGCAGGIWPTVKTFKSLVCYLLSILSPIPPILLSLALLFLFWGIVKYIKSGGNEEELKQGKNVIIFGLVSVFAILAVWGLVTFLGATLGLGGRADYNIKSSDFNWSLPANI